MFLTKNQHPSLPGNGFKGFFQREPYKSQGLFCYAQSLQILAKTSACESAELSNCTCFLYISSSWNEIRRKVCCTERRKKKILVSWANPRKGLSLVKDRFFYPCLGLAIIKKVVGTLFHSKACGQCMHSTLTKIGNTSFHYNLWGQHMHSPMTNFPSINEGPSGGSIIYRPMIGIFWCPCLWCTYSAWTKTQTIKFLR